MADEAMTDERPLLDTIMDMTAASVERADLDDRELLMVRLAALAAVGAPVSSYLLSVAAAAGTSMTLEDARSVLITIAPIVGVPKVIDAAALDRRRARDRPRPRRRHRRVRRREVLMILAYDYPLLGVFWSLFMFAMFVLWIFIVVFVFIDNFRRTDHHGVAKGLWFLFIVFVPVIGVLAYLITRPAEPVVVVEPV